MLYVPWAGSTRRRRTAPSGAAATLGVGTCFCGLCWSNARSIALARNHVGDDVDPARRGDPRLYGAVPVGFLRPQSVKDEAWLDYLSRSSGRCRRPWAGVALGDGGPARARGPITYARPDRRAQGRTCRRRRRSPSPAGGARRGTLGFAGGARGGTGSWRSRAGVTVDSCGRRRGAEGMRPARQARKYQTSMGPNQPAECSALREFG